MSEFLRIQLLSFPLKLSPRLGHLILYANDSCIFLSRLTVPWRPTPCPHPHHRGVYQTLSEIDVSPLCFSGSLKIPPPGTVSVLIMRGSEVSKIKH